MHATAAVCQLHVLGAGLVGALVGAGGAGGGVGGGGVGGVGGVGTPGEKWHVPLSVLQYVVTPSS